MTMRLKRCWIFLAGNFAVSGGFVGMIVSGLLGDVMNLIHYHRGY